jgi:hypothetical protein
MLRHAYSGSTFHVKISPNCSLYFVLFIIFIYLFIYLFTMLVGHYTGSVLRLLPYCFEDLLCI